MSVKRWVMGAGEVATLRDEADFRAVAQDQALLLLSEGRPSLVWNSWCPISLWTAVQGTGRLGGRDLRLELASDDVFVAEHGSRLTFQASGVQGASLLALFLPPEQVRRVARRELGLVLDDPLVFPALHRHQPALALPLLRLAQAALREGGNGAGVSAALDEIIVGLLKSQAPLEALVSRCPGRSPRYRRQVLTRLLRARDHIDHVAGADCSLGRLAEVARMSPTHFLRLYRDVFGQTPHKDVVATRLAAARDLLLRSSLGVSEICRTLSFENRCAFARVFKQFYGVSPTAMRAQAQSAEHVIDAMPAPATTEVVAPMQLYAEAG
jgi:AraC family transcriptional regulator